MVIGDPELDTSLAILSGTAVNQDGRCEEFHSHRYHVQLLMNIIYNNESGSTLHLFTITRVFESFETCLRNPHHRFIDTCTSIKRMIYIAMQVELVDSTQRPVPAGCDYTGPSCGRFDS